MFSLKFVYIIFLFTVLQYAKMPACNAKRFPLRGHLKLKLPSLPARKEGSVVDCRMQELNKLVGRAAPVAVAVPSPRTASSFATAKTTHKSFSCSFNFILQQQQQQRGWQPTHHQQHPHPHPHPQPNSHSLLHPHILVLILALQYSGIIFIIIKAERGKRR